MQYFQAVQEGKIRSNKAQMRLFEIAGFAMLTLTTKIYSAVIKKPEGYVVLLVDEDGYTKTQSKDLEKDEATKIFKKVEESGIEEFSGNEIKIWTEAFPTIQNELK